MFFLDEREEEPEFGLGHDIVGGEDAHGEGAWDGVALGWKWPSDHQVLLHLHLQGGVDFHH